MQEIAFITIGYTRMRVLIRTETYGKAIRKADGEIQPSDTYREEESEYLSQPENYMLVQQLHEGKTIHL